MKFVSFEGARGEDWGVLTDQGLVKSEALGMALPATLAGFVAACGQQAGLLDSVRDAAARATAVPLASVRQLPCIPRPGKILCLGVNYVDHAKEGGNTIADYPAVFLRSATSLLAHGAPLKVPAISDKLDYEAEFALVISRTARCVSEADALSHVFGYACFNDGSVRDYQRKTTQWTVGKNFDGTGAFGPWLVTADELPPGAAGLRIQSRLNGQVMQDANTSDMAFNVVRTISLLSHAMTLEAGDVIVMGTPGGVGYARTPPVFMKAGDTIEIEVEGMGVLSNPVTA